MNAKLIQVIQTTHSIGQGTPEDPSHEIIHYFTTDGVLLAVDNTNQGTFQGTVQKTQPMDGSTAYEALKKIQSQITTCHL